MYLLNYLYFIAITGLGYKWLTAREGYLKNPLDRTQLMRLDGPEMFWILTFATGLLAFAAPGTLNLMALRLWVLEIFCFVGLFVVKRKPIWSVASILYLVFILWLCIGLVYTPSPMYGLRVIMKYVYVLLIMLFASAAVRYVEVFLKAAIAARTVAIISIAVAFIPFVGKLFPGVFWYGTAEAINYISMFIFSLALFYFTNEKKKNLLLSILFVLPCILWVFRTSIVGTTLALMTFMFFKYKLKALPVMVVVLVLFLVAIFYIPAVREKMFFDDSSASISQVESGEISMDNINTNGRSAMWAWCLGKFYTGHELAGCGTGNLQETFYSLRHPFGTIKICHNDYVQILCDNGLIGLILFGASFLCAVFHCFIIYNSRRYDMAIRLCAIVAGASMTGTLLTLYTDNVINYSMATISYPCGFYGMMLGMLAKYKQQ